MKTFDLRIGLAARMLGRSGKGGPKKPHKQFDLARKRQGQPHGVHKAERQPEAAFVIPAPVGTPGNRSRR
ncbi:hypothetical protein [Bordetella genomosp. 9]|uniref:hypothetical protein n=1 Tax=Bordetella genomosp. 9 TaxID=1416803 RepID=UPI0012F7355C|nr:hypothetical protein [Bordetella genomosp. 9]